MKDRVYDQETLKKLQAVELEILHVVHEFCVNHKIKYSLAYGTLIGAVRHKGFIPWDDDIDIMMPRKDYEKFINIWEQKSPQGYILQSYGQNDGYENNFIKIRKDKTTFIETEEEKSQKYHHGIFIDIYPCDIVPNGRLNRKIQFAYCAVNLLFSRGHGSGSGGVLGIAEQLLLKIIPKKKYISVQKWAERKIRKWNGTISDSIMLSDTIRAPRRTFPSNVFDNLVMMRFCNGDYSVIADYDILLKKVYNDYWQLPPEEERTWKHHPILINFESNFKDSQLSNDKGALSWEK